MINNNPGSFSGGEKKTAIFDVLNSNKNSRLTLGLRIIKAVYKVDGFMGFYRQILYLNLTLKLKYYLF